MRLPGEPIHLKYEGLDADGHTADAVLLGQSIQGTARVYNSIINWHFSGQFVVPIAQSVKVHVGPTKEGSLLYMIYLMMVHGKMAVYPEILFELAGFAIPQTLKAVIARRSGQTKLMEKTIDVMHDMYVRHDELASKMHDGHMQDKAHIYGMVERLASANKRPLAEMAAPVGKTVRQIEHFSSEPEPVLVDEPTAEALRSKEEAVVGEQQKFFGRILAVDKVSGTGKVLLDGESLPVRVKITDPVLSVPENVYTHALDTDTRVSIDAKPVTKGDEISTLYVSNASAAES